MLFSDALSFRSGILSFGICGSCFSRKVGVMVSEGCAGVGVESFGSMALIYVIEPLFKILLMIQDNLNCETNSMRNTKEKKTIMDTYVYKAPVGS